MTEPWAYLNGEWLPASRTALSLTDAGFILGAAVAEQIRTFRGKLFRLEDHLDRLWRSLAIVGIDPGLSRQEMAGIAEELVRRNYALEDPANDLGVSVFVTPGLYPGYSPPTPTTPTVGLHTYRLPFRLWAAKYAKGQPLVTPAIEQVSPRCWPPQLKCRSRMHYYLADREAAALDPEARALLLTSEGWVAEASTANIIVVFGTKRLVFPPRTRTLPGISLAVTVELARRVGLATIEADLNLGDLYGASEILLTSTPYCLLWVCRLNSRVVGDGKPGPIFQKLLTEWNRLVGLDIVEQARQFADQ